MIEYGINTGCTRNGILYKSGTGPEGIVVFHEAGRLLFKATIEHDEQHKFELTNEELITGDVSLDRQLEALLDDEINPNAEDRG
jgi:hypothetical protein